MTTFVPSGYITLPSAIDLVIERHFGQDRRAITAEYASLVKLEEDFRQRGFRRLHGAIRVPSGAKIDEWVPFEATLSRIGLLRIQLNKLDSFARDRAINIVWQALGDGAFGAAAITDNGHLSKVPIEAWRAKGGHEAINLGRISWHDRSTRPSFVVGCPLIEKSEFERWLIGAANIRVEQHLTAWLVARMQANPDQPRPKNDVRQEATALGFAVSDASWERCWADAVKQANTPKWSAPGRRPKQ
jgi:hypothetical protein